VYLKKKNFEKSQKTKEDNKKTGSWDSLTNGNLGGAQLLVIISWDRRGSTGRGTAGSTDTANAGRGGSMGYVLQSGNWGGPGGGSAWGTWGWIFSSSEPGTLRVSNG
jgi:hypothetical protein